jgi:hypothetical protein
MIGQISYAGTQVGQILVDAIRPGEQDITSRYGIGMDNIGPYDMVVRIGTYIISAYMDTNYDNKQDPNEPFGFYDANGDGKADEISVRGKVTGINITLHDPQIHNAVINNKNLIGLKIFIGSQLTFPWPTTFV